jgi:multiple sugar transport system ATP-binding protein
MAQIRVENLRKQFGTFTAVKGSSFTIEDGSFFVMLGPSGCGKTTTLRMIAGLELPSEGRILLDREDVTFLRASRRDIAFVFQMFALYPHLNVRRNIAYPLRCQGVPRAEIKQRVGETARLLQIEHLLDRSVSGLSGGDRQRVALGRAIVRRPKAFLMDEPLGALDSEFRRVMCGELRQLHERIGATTVYVTHDQLEAMAMADQIAVMNRGVVEQIATPQQIYDAPASMFVADFIGSPPMSFLRFDGGVRQGDHSVRIGDALVEVPALREEGVQGALALGARPEHVLLASDGPLRGRVLGAEYLGTTQIVTLETQYGQIKARLASTKPVRLGDNVGIEFRTERLALFDAASGRALHSGAQHG